MNGKDYKNFEVKVDDRGVATIRLDVPGRPMNVIDASVLTELDLILGELEVRDDIRLVIFESSKESGFLAGADVDVIRQIKSPDEAEEMLRRGQEVFDRLEALPMITMVLIHGPCLGGGLEWALACDYRIARDNTSTKIGLPEIKLGLIPGWGGTQRLPRVVGLADALEMILTGKHLSADRAYSSGLVDRAIRPGRWEDEVNRLIQSVLSNGHLPKFAGQSRAMAFLERLPPVRNYILATAEKKVAKKVDHYPALASAIHAIELGFRSKEQGLAAERSEFAKLLETPTCRSLLQLFFSREAARTLTTWAPGSVRVIHQRPIQKLGVIGAGAMGAGIVQLAATRGFDVRVKEVDEAAVDMARQRIDRMLADYGKRKHLSAAELAALRDRIELSAEASVLSDTDCVIEAVVERMDVKQRVFVSAEKATTRSTILATNTSALSVAEMASVLEQPKRFAGVHFFNPVHRMELVEVVRGEQTDDATIEKLVAFVKALGKTPVVTTDSPGFIVNRILFPYLGKAIALVLQGESAQKIDREARRFGMPMGPVELLDQVGLDVALNVAGTLGDTVESSSQVITFLEAMVRENQCGVKTKLGFYDYHGRRKQARERSSLPIKDVVMPPRRKVDVDRFVEDGFSPLQRELIYPMLAEAARCRDEKIVQHAWAIDLAMVLGTGFAPHRGGPLTVIESVGQETFRDNLRLLGQDRPSGQSAVHVVS
ncbi:MAG: 3-hydroxyacyl-CoA dehydrogenase NAD-binding domain-containing protein [Planctomycetota bacterium]